MDPSRSRRPSLPRLTTNVPPACRSSASLPPVPLVTKSIDAKLQEPPCKPTLFLDDKKDDENIAPLLRYAADVKPPVVEQSTEEPPITKTKTSYYDDAFAFRGAHNSPQERVAQDSVVVAELKTNYKSKHEHHQVMADFLFRLAQIYQRPETSIMVTYNQETHIIYGSNTTLRSYLLTIYALPSLIAPVTNLRNTTLIQNALQDLLGIAPALGVVIYIPVPEDNFATNGVTVRGEISRLERNEESPSLFKTISRGMIRRLKSNSGKSAPLSQPSPSGVISPSSNPKSDPVRSPVTTKPTDGMMGEDKGQGLRKRDSFRALVRRRLIDKVKEEKDTEKNEKEGVKEKDIKGEEKEDLKEGTEDVAKDAKKDVLKEKAAVEDTKEHDGGKQ